MATAPLTAVVVSMRPWLLLVPALLVILSGCAGQAVKTDIKDVEKPASTQGIDDPDKGKVLGVVVDDEALPVEGASAALFAAGAVTPSVATTGGAGEFAFFGLEPGTYLLVVQKIGFQDATEKHLQVEGGKTLERTIALVPLPSNEPRSETREFNGLISGWGYKLPAPVNQNEYLPLACGASCSRNGDFWKTSDRPDGLRNMVGELKWGNTQATGENLLYIVFINGFGNSENAAKTFIRQEGKSVITVVVPAERIQAILAADDPKCKPSIATCDIGVYVWPGTGNTGGDADFALALQQTFTSMVTTFFRMDAPAGFSAFT